MVDARRIKATVVAALHRRQPSPAADSGHAWVARFRVIYRPAVRHVIEIVAIGPQNRIYEETLRLVSTPRDR